MPDLLMPKRVKSRSVGEPYATETLLGWVLNSPLKPSTQRSDNQIENYFVQSEDAVLNDLVEHFWRLDSVCVSDERVMFQVDKRVTKLWNISVERKNGHYVLPIPFKDDIIMHATGLNVAEKRLQLLKRRFGRDLSLKVKYVGAMKELLEKGFAEKVPSGQVGAMQRMHYLPHHSVINLNKPKLRIVFDCAAKGNGPSLSEQVWTGLDITNKLIRVLLRFREENIALVADVNSMFH